MVKIRIGCHLFILNTIHCPGGPKYYFNRTQILHSFGILPIHSVSILYDNCCQVSRHSVDLLRLIHCIFRANGSDRYSVLCQSIRYAFCMIIVAGSVNLSVELLRLIHCTFRANGSDCQTDTVYNGRMGPNIISIGVSPSRHAIPSDCNARKGPTHPP